jgi:hypothetical protein
LKEDAVDNVIQFEAQRGVEVAPVQPEEVASRSAMRYLWQLDPAAARVLALVAVGLLARPGTSEGLDGDSATSIARIAIAVLEMERESPGASPRFEKVVSAVMAAKREAIGRANGVR